MKEPEIIIFEKEIMVILKENTIDEVTDIKIKEGILKIKIKNKIISSEIGKIILEKDSIYITDMKSFRVKKENAPAIIITGF